MNWQQECESVADAVQAAVGAIPEHQGAVVTGFVLVATVLDADGEKRCNVWDAPDQRTWESYGLLEWAHQQHVTESE